MDSPLVFRDSFEDLGQKLRAWEEKLRRYHQLALAGRLVGATMHEVNNRLAALTNLIFLARTLAESPTRIVEYLDEADSQLRSLGEITNRSLGFIRMDSEAIEVDLVELATSALHLHQQYISKKSINVETRSPETAFAFVKKVRFSKYLLISCSTAIEALPDSGKLHVRVVRRGAKAIITVADSGSGIPESMRTTLFESFKSTKLEGNGLGLWIVKEIVKGHEGTIQYRSSSTPGKSGPTFRIALPISQAA